MDSFKKKIIALSDLSKKIQELHSKKYTVVHCHGVFDLLHIGHIRYFKRAKAMGDILVVTITPDRYVDKGPHRPAFTENLRIEAVASLDCVDYVALNLWPTAEETLRQIRPDYYVKGSEFKQLNSDPTGKIELEAETCKEIGCNLKFTEDIVFSSSNLINRYFLNLPDELQGYLNLFKKRHSLEDVLSILDNINKLNILVIGDVIIDDYHYCEAIGKSSKDPILALRYESHDIFAGGACAVANHIAGFSNQVTLLTTIGNKNSYEIFIRNQLAKNITPIFHEKTDACTTLKRRFIDGYSTNKLFEVCFINPEPLPSHHDAAMAKDIQRISKECDVVVVSDFGHGTIGPQCVEAINALNMNVAVNTQANAANRGFNTISKYPGRKMLCIAEHELRLECRNEKGNIRGIIHELASRLNCSILFVTRGRLGCEIYNTNIPEFTTVPSFATMVTDRVGAGDAFLSLAALGYALGIEPELSGFLGSIMGTLAVGTIGNEKALNKQNVHKFITSLLK